MKIIFAEFQPNYSKYWFPYQVLAVREKGDKLEDIYAAGFLPFRHQPNLFYLARSCRSNLKKFALSSENRRIIKKTSQYAFEWGYLEQFDYTPTVQKTCKDWARGCGWQISVFSIKKLFSGEFFNRVIVAKKKKKIVAYGILKVAKTLVHWAYVFYHPGEKKTGLIIRMGLEIIFWAKKEGKKFVYLGTCYQGGWYKRNFPGFEFFNGVSWSSDLEELKRLNEHHQGYYLPIRIAQKG